MKKRWVQAIMLAALLVTGAFIYNKYRIAPSVKPEQLELAYMDGETFNLNKFKDKHLFINFFATWCPPCVKEIPSLTQAQRTLQKEDFLFILISDESPERLKAFQSNMQTPLLILHSKKKLKEYKIFTLPTSYLFDKRNKMVFSKIGDAEWNSKDMLNQLTKAASTR